MPARLKHAMCNEAFGEAPFAETVRTLKQIGYEGIEIAPFTLAPEPTEVSPAQRKECRDVMASEGLDFVGLHWIMVGPPGLHVTTPDAAVRERSWNHIRHLIDLCADLGENTVMVFGSPKQRSATGGLTKEEATKHYVDGLAAVAPQAEARKITILVEALPQSQSNVVQTLKEAVDIVHAINSPAIQTMFDVHNTEDETEPHTALLEKYFHLIRHVHVNEMDGKHPGTGNYDFGPVLRKLQELNYGGWVSLEAFDFEVGASNLASQSLRYLKQHE